MADLYLLLGSNQGDSRFEIEKSLKKISERIGQITALSSLYETEPWGFESKQNFLNQVVLAKTIQSPEIVLKNILKIETEAGRIRSETKYSSRIIDIDILFYDDMVVKNENLTIPHPLLHRRKFTLEPLKEIAPDFLHPVFKKTVVTLYNECHDLLVVKKLNTNK